jgi:hypothetical protein
LCSDSQSKFGDSGIINGGAADANTQIQFFATKALIFSEGASNTKMTLNATGLGIGMGPANNLSIGSATYASFGVKIDSITQSSLIFKGTPDAVGYEHAKIVSGRESSPFTYGSFLAFYTEGKNSGSTDTSIERLRIDSSGNLNIANGNLVMTTSGKGIDFGATTPDGTGTMTSELLNDYEEGTFTPVIIGTTSAGTATYAIQVGIYTKIGRTVQFQLDVSYSAGTGTGNLRVSNLPFTNGGYLYPVTVYPLSIGMTALYYGAGILANGVSYIDMQQLPTGGGSDLSVPYDAAGRIIITGTYNV